jgi:hypothetical protein
LLSLDLAVSEGGEASLNEVLLLLLLLILLLLLLYAVSISTSLCFSAVCLTTPISLISSTPEAETPQLCSLSINAG